MTALTPEGEALFFEHLWLCDVLARRMGVTRRAASLDELLSFAREGLLHAATRFNPNLGDFLPYANIRIRGAIIDGLRTQGHLTRNRHAALDAEEELGRHIGHLETFSVDGVMHLGAEPATPDEELERAELLHLTQKALGALSFREQELLRRHYFEGERFDHVAEELGISKSWASRIHTKALGRLARSLRNL